MLWRALLCMGCGYLAGSMLSFHIVARLLGKRGMLAQSRDDNPGTANAFLYGGFWCGLLTLIGDLLKGALPVLCYRMLGGDFEESPLLSALVLVSPVLGHAFPVFFGFRGGKAIAVTFGCLLGLTPYLTPGIILAAVFILLSLGIRISPHFYRTLATYFLSCILIALWYVRLDGELGVLLGFLFMTATVSLKMHMSREKRERLKVRFLWMH